MRKVLPILALTTLLFTLSIRQAAASATFSLSPATGSYTLNSIFNVDVKFDTGADSVKTIRAYLPFPANLLSVDDISTTGTAVVTWSERLYSNTNGTISLSGDTASTGTSGSGKLLATVKFKVKGNGVASVKFVSSSEIFRTSDDGDVLSLTSSTNGSYNLGTVTTQPTASPSGITVPETGMIAPTQAIIAISLFLIILGIWLGRSIYQNS